MARGRTTFLAKNFFRSKIFFEWINLNILLSLSREKYQKFLWPFVDPKKSFFQKSHFFETSIIFVMHLISVPYQIMYWIRWVYIYLYCMTYTAWGLHSRRYSVVFASYSMILFQPGGNSDMFIRTTFVSRRKTFQIH